MRYPENHCRQNDRDPLPPGQVWIVSAGGGDENPGLYQVDITEGPGSGVKILNQPAAEAIGRLSGLTNFPFIALELSQTCTEEQVTDVFVRINSEGKKLNQSDFILTLMSVFWDVLVK